MKVIDDLDENSLDRVVRALLDGHGFKRDKRGLKMTVDIRC